MIKQISDNLADIGFIVIVFSLLCLVVALIISIIKDLFND